MYQNVYTALLLFCLHFCVAIMLLVSLRHATACNCIFNTLFVVNVGGFIYAWMGMGCKYICVYHFNYQGTFWTRRKGCKWWMNETGQYVIERERWGNVWCDGEGKAWYLLSFFFLIFIQYSFEVWVDMNESMILWKIDREIVFFFVCHWIWKWYFWIWVFRCLSICLLGMYLYIWVLKCLSVCLLGEDIFVCLCVWGIN